MNAGMFDSDHKTHVGHLGSKVHVNSSHVNKYMSVAAFDPMKGKGLPEKFLKTTGRRSSDTPRLKAKIIGG